MPEQKTMEERARQLVGDYIVLIAGAPSMSAYGLMRGGDLVARVLELCQSVAREAREAEREACAKVAEELWVSEPTDYPQQIAQAIREREGNGSEGKHE